MEPTKLKETSEAFAAIALLVNEAIKLGKNGYGVDDLGQALKDLTTQEASAVLFAGIQGDSQILGEISNLDWLDRLEALCQGGLTAIAVIRAQKATA